MVGDRCHSNSLGYHRYGAIIAPARGIINMLGAHMGGTECHMDGVRGHTNML